jgi:hypothetical protein
MFCRAIDDLVPNDGMNNPLIDAAVIAYQSGNELAFTALYHDWLCCYLHAFAANACSDAIGMNSEELISLAHAVAAHAARSWKPGAGACFKIWLCRLWRQRLSNAIHSNRTNKAAGRRRTVSLDHLTCDTDNEFYESVADPAASNPADILVALEVLEQRLFIESVKR